MRRVLSILSVTLVTAGAVVLADAAITLAWKEPVSALYGQISQNQARTQLRDDAQSFLAGTDIGRINRIIDPIRRARRLADAFSRKLSTGKPIGQIRIPSANVDYVIIEGTDTASLKRGPGRYPQTFLPGQENTIGIAGHRTTYGAPFHDIEKISDGDPITIEMPYATFTYRVQKSKIVEPSDTQIVRTVGRERLVLTACHPLYSAAQRYAVFADLIDVTLLPSDGKQSSSL